LRDNIRGIGAICMPRNLRRLRQSRKVVQTSAATRLADELLIDLHDPYTDQFSRARMLLDVSLGQRGRFISVT
jgi:hypothetical protein